MLVELLLRGLHRRRRVAARRTSHRRNRRGAEDCEHGCEQGRGEPTQHALTLSQRPVRPGDVTGPGAGHDRLGAGYARRRRAGRSARAGRPERRSRPQPGPAASPAQARIRASSPLRNRWQRTPPVARPLAGYSENGVTLTAPGSVPGSAVDEPRRVTTTADAGVERAEPDDRLAGGELDAGHAAAAAALRPHAGGAEVQQLGVGGDEAQLLVAGAQLDRADDLVAVLEPDHLPLVAGRAPRG